VGVGDRRRRRIDAEDPRSVSDIAGEEGAAGRDALDVSPILGCRPLDAVFAIDCVDGVFIDVDLRRADSGNRC
jgi:hypothetical protein